MFNKIWLESYQSSVPAEIDPDAYPSLDHLFNETVQTFRALVAYRHEGKELTYNALEQKVHAFAAFLQQTWGLQKGDRLAIMLPNCLQYPIVLYAALKIGLTVVNVNPLYTTKEFVATMKDSGATAVVVLENFAHVVESGWAQTDLTRVCVTGLGDVLGFKGTVMNGVIRYVKRMVPAWHLPHGVRWKKAMQLGAMQRVRPVRLTGEDIALLQYTGGTTGGTKGAILTHRNMVANIMQAAAWVGGRSLRERLSPGGMVTALPLYHIFSLTANCLTFFYLGIDNILITNPRDIKKLIRTLCEEQCIAMSGVNTLFNAMLNHPDFHKIDFSHFYIALGGGAAIQRPVAERWKSATNTLLLEAYGLTEASPAVCINPLDLKGFNGSVGLPVSSTEVQILDPTDGTPCPIGDIGELCIRGPQVMRGYWKQPKETAAVLRAGWLHTGDLAYMDAKGFVYIVDRMKDLILVSGFNVYPNEIEAVLVEHPAVLEAAVVGMADPHSGEAPRAYVVLRTSADATAEELIAHCRTELTSYKIPKEIVFCKTLPKTNVGKILRRAVRDGSHH